MPGRENERRSSSVLIFCAPRHTAETDLIGGSVCPGVYGFFRFRAGRKQFQQHLVTLPFEFCDRTAVSLLQYAVDNGLLHLGTELSDRAEIFPPCGNRAGEVFHEVLNPAFAACEMEQ